MATLALSRCVLQSDDSFVEQLNRWLPKTRWFTGNKSFPEAVITEEFPLGGSENTAAKLLIVSSGDTQFFVPVVLRLGSQLASGTVWDHQDDGNLPKLGRIATICAPLPPNASSSFTKTELATQASTVEQVALVSVLDATDDPYGQELLLRCCLGDLANEAHIDPRIETLASKQNSTKIPALKNFHRLNAEQSNTSIIYEFKEADSHGSEGLIVKLLRIVNIGANPDIELQAALAGQNPRTVPLHYGSARVRASHGLGYADLLVGQELLRGCVDAWQMFQAELNTPSSEPNDPNLIRSLGALSADFHSQLRELFPTDAPTPGRKAEIYSTWVDRCNEAIEAAPELAEYRSEILGLFDRARNINWPDLQRVHGDYHLGQVLFVPHLGWRAVDFEGEPLRPLFQRSQSDLSLRDVAGMLRSFDYAAGAVVLNGKPENVARAWAKNAQALFMSGYGALSNEEELLLGALILEKALYEVVYEATYRPRWLTIPVQAVKDIFVSRKSTSVNSLR
ncbi:hypothetical protein [Arcanobacterium ihumii]|uniref:hypothetical protein n=1 Tax=Arcanobacterium ihumii TaxID=2138162 RepID=UPI000F53B79C|nr:hypothetical protein [Arcanobacterium ihumii]